MERLDNLQETDQQKKGTRLSVESLLDLTSGLILYYGDLLLDIAVAISLYHESQAMMRQKQVYFGTYFQACVFLLIIPG